MRLPDESRGAGGSLGNSRRDVKFGGTGRARAARRPQGHPLARRVLSFSPVCDISTSDNSVTHGKGTDRDSRLWESQALTPLRRVRRERVGDGASPAGQPEGRTSPSSRGPNGSMAGRAHAAETAAPLHTMYPSRLRRKTSTVTRKTASLPRLVCGAVSVEMGGSARSRQSEWYRGPSDGSSLNESP